MAIGENTIVKIHYKGTLEDGTIFDSSEGREPLEFIFGMGMIIPGLENGLLGLGVGDKKIVKIASAEAYGPVIDQAIQEVPKSQFPADIELAPGVQLAAQGPHGVIPVSVKEIKDDIVVVDFNHPLAGKDLTFDVTVVDVSEATEEQKEKFMAMLMGSQGGCGCGDDHDCSSCGDSCGCEDEVCECGDDCDCEPECKCNDKKEN